MNFPDQQFGESRKKYSRKGKALRLASSERAKKLQMVPDPKQAASVFDFLYADLQRLGLLLSQFGEDGILTELTRQTDETTEKGGAVGPKFAQLNLKDAAKQGLTKKFDPRWMVPLKFLDVAQDILHRDIVTANLGQLVLIEGSIGIADLSMIQGLWDEPMIRELIASGIPQEDLETAGVNRKDRRRQGNTRPPSPNSGTQNLLSFIGTLMKMLPHAVHVTLYTKDLDQVWGTLNQNDIVGSSADLLLKHGTALSGKWHMVAILDAIPNGVKFDQDQFLVEQLQKETMMGQITSGIRPILENGFARPATSYAVTPLIIMRPIDSRLSS